MSCLRIVEKKNKCPELQDILDDKCDISGMFLNRANYFIIFNRSYIMIITFNGFWNLHYKMSVKMGRKDAHHNLPECLLLVLSDHRPKSKDIHFTYNMKQGVLKQLADE